MTIYTYQPQDLIDLINTHGFAPVEFTKTNLHKQTQAGTGSPQHHDAYMWMARKLSEKTGLWMKSVYGDDLDLPKDADGDYIDEEGQKLPLLPFWGWYLTDGKNQKPDPEMYCFDSRVASVMGDWSMSESKTMLLTLNVPEKLVLLSDANAWYCVLEGRPCYEYEEESVEAEMLESYRSRYESFLSMPEKTAKQREAKAAVAEELWQECVSSWDNILRLEGRRLKNFMGEMECYDIQAAFPVIMKDWIVSVEEV